MTGVLLQVSAGVVVTPVAVLAAAAGATVLMRHRRVTPRRALTVSATVAYGAAVFTLTFFPLQIATGDHANRVSWLEKVNLIPVLTVDVRTFLLNVLLFIPFGLLLPLWRRSATWADAARWGLALSAIIEAGQWTTDVLVSSGRTADVNDLIANTVGAVVGFGILRATTRSGGGPVVVDSWAITPPSADHRVRATSR